MVYPMGMMTLHSPRHKALASAIAQVLTPAERSMVRELIAAEVAGRPAPGAEDMMYWMRLNMPTAAIRVEDILHPFPLGD